MERIKVNWDAICLDIRKAGITKASISKAMGFGESYISNCASRNQTLDKPIFISLMYEMGVSKADESKYIIPEPKPVEIAKTKAPETDLHLKNVIQSIRSLSESMDSLMETVTAIERRLTNLDRRTAAILEKVKQDPYEDAKRKVINIFGLNEFVEVKTAEAQRTAQGIDLETWKIIIKDLGLKRKTVGNKEYYARR